MKINKGIILPFLSIFVLTMFSGCGQTKIKVSSLTRFSNWNEVLKEGKNQTATILMWGGNDNINKYMDGYVSKNVKEKFGITLKRVPMDAPVFVSKLLNEKKSNLDKGTADLLWISGENFKSAKDARLLWGPFTDLLPNMNKYYDKSASDLNFDSGIPVEGSEGIWGRAQLVFTYDSEVVPSPPKSFKELLVWAKKNPGKFTYPKLPDDFAGSVFVRSAYYELTGKSDVFQKDMTKEQFIEISKPVVAYFKELNKYLWHEGKAYPATQAQQDNLFKNGEISMTMGFEVGKTAGLVQSGAYPKTVKTFVFNTGTIGNSHYLAVPFNAPSKAAALLVMDFLESPQAQIEKLKANVWGDMPAFDESKITDSQKGELTKAQSGEGSVSIKEITGHRLAEMKSEYIDWIKEIWADQIGGK